MNVRRILAATVACGLLSVALSAGSAQAAKGPKAKDYIYCDKSGTESVCFPTPIEVFRMRHTWVWHEGEEVSGTVAMSGKHYVFRETKPESRDELIGTRGKHGVISGTLYENGKPSEFTFTLTPTP